jgi:hypothetical protein
MSLFRTVRSIFPCLFVALAALFAPAARAQQASSSESPIPVITGDFSFQTTFQPGMQDVMPEFDPVVLVPIGHKFLVESEFDMSMDLSHYQGQWGPAVVDHGVEYLQLDYIVNPRLTIVTGRFLTPFGIYRERLHPMWIRDLANEPLIFPMNDNSSNGAMLRGVTSLRPGMDLTYATYYSAPASNSQFFANRQAGGRASLFFPNKRVEVGVSYSRVLNQHYNMVGADLTWTWKKIPFDLRSELIHSATVGSGYWVEGDYRLNKLGTNAFFRNSELALRGEQYFVPKMAQSLILDLPTQSTTRASLGWNYYLHNGLRFDASYGRNFASGANHNTWTMGLTYRFAAF